MTRDKQLSRVGHLLPWPSIGGVEAATLRIVSAVEGADFTNVAFCLRGAAAVRTLFEKAGVPVVEYEAVEPSLRRPWQYLRASLRLARQLRKAHVDLVHCSDLLAAHRCSLAAWLAGVPLITHVRGRFPAVSARDRCFLMPVRRFVFVSKNTRMSFGVQVSESRATVLYDGIAPMDPSLAYPTDVRNELNIPAQAPIIGMVARVAPVKDYPTIIEAAEAVVRAHPRAVFLIVGQHSGVREYSDHYVLVQRLIAERGLTAHFVFTDHRDDVERLIAAMDVCILASHDEGLPLVILEAMRQGKPFIATAVGGIPEIIIDGVTGVLIPPATPAALARAITALLDDRDTAQALGNAAREYVSVHFNERRFASELRALYRGVLEQPARTLFTRD